MTLKNIVAAMAAGIALASPLAARAYEYNDGTYKWGFETYENDDNEQVACLYDVCRVDGQKIEGAFAFPATVSLTVTNELGYSKYDETTGKYNWVSTRPQKVVTLTLPVEGISWNSFYYEEKFEDETWTEFQYDPLITSITIPEGVKYVYGLVGECLTNVTAVTFPSTVEDIESCFGYCDKLASVSVPEDAYIDSAFIGTPWAQSMGDFFIWNGNLIRYQGTASEVVVPEGVETLGTAAFAPYYRVGWTAKESWEMFASATNITSVLLPSSLEEIGDDAFFGCEKLAAIDIPNGVYAIGYEAFEYTALTAITLPKSIRSLGGAAFAYTAISSLTIPEGVQYLLSTCAYMTNLTSVTIPSRAKYLYCTFNGCSKLASVDIPASVERIEYNTFGGCAALTSVTGGAGLKYVDSDAFGDDPHWDYEKHEYVDGTGVPFYDNAADGFRVLGPVAYGYKGKCPENLTVPAGVKYVMNSVIPYNSDKSAVKTITLSDGVETVGNSAFSYCANLETVNLGNTVTNLGSSAFYQNGRSEYDEELGYFVYKPGKLATVTGGAALEVGRDAFGGTLFLENLRAKAGSDDPFGFLGVGNVVLAYQGQCPADVVIPDNVTEFAHILYGGSDEKESATNITSVTGGAGLRGYVPLYGLDNVKRIEIAGAVESVDIDSNYALEVLDVRNAQTYDLEDYYIDFGATNLTQITIGLSSDYCELESDVFKNCAKLESLNFVCKGYKVTGFETWFETGKETFPNDLSTFKYIGERLNFSAPDEDGYVEWNSFYLYPTFVKVVVDESALEPFVNGVKSDYVGMLYDADYKLVGTFEVTVQKATAKKDATATVKITPLNGKKESVKGTVDANGNGQGALAGLVFGANGVTGTLTAPKNNATFILEGASDATKSKDKDVKDYLKDLKGKTWGVVFEPNGKVQSDLANGYIALSVTMNNTGKAKVAGVLPDGNKVSVSTKIIVGADTCAIPVAFSKSGESFGFILWTDLEGKAKDVTDVSDWAGKVQKVTFVQGEQAFDCGDALKPLSVPVFRIGDLPDALANSIDKFLPEYVAFDFKKGDAAMWDFAKAPTIKAKKGVIDWEKIEADVEKGKTNFSGLKLKVNKKTGEITGSFTLYSFNNKNALKKTKVTVNGVMVDGVGYGVGFVKKTGACFVEIGESIEEE